MWRFGARILSIIYVLSVLRDVRVRSIKVCCDSDMPADMPSRTRSLPWSSWMIPGFSVDRLCQTVNLIQASSPKNCGQTAYPPARRSAKVQKSNSSVDVPPTVHGSIQALRNDNLTPDAWPPPLFVSLFRGFPCCNFHARPAVVPHLTSRSPHPNHYILQGLIQWVSRIFKYPCPPQYKQHQTLVYSQWSYIVRIYSIRMWWILCLHCFS